MRKYTLFLLTFFILTFVGLTFAGQSDNQKITPPVIDQQVEQLVSKKQPYVVEKINKSEKDVIKSLIADINSMCGNFNVTDTSLLNSAKCTITDSNGNRVTYKISCQGKFCTFTKAVHAPITIKQTPISVDMQATPNVPPQSEVSTEKWLKIFAGLVYAALTVYLLMVASSNLLKRELLFLIVDLLLWAALTSAMYVVYNGGF